MWGIDMCTFSYLNTWCGITTLLFVQKVIYVVLLHYLLYKRLFDVVSFITHCTESHFDEQVACKSYVL